MTTALINRERNRVERLTVDLPAGMLTTLKIHAAERERTIREVVTGLIKVELNEEQQT